MSRYTQDFDPENGELMTVAEFKAAALAGAYTDYDGFGRLVDGNLMRLDPDHYVSPSILGDIPADATHIMWYNS